MSITHDTPQPRRAGFAPVLVATIVLGAVACEREPGSTLAQPVTAAAASRIDFPGAVRADDPSVNRFVQQITDACAEGDYERFRLLWAVREDPFPRQEFERGWKALKKVKVLALQKMKTRAGDYLYYIHVRMELDESMRKPAREVVVMIVKENDQWRLARAPAHLRKRVLGTADDGPPGESPPRDPPKAQEPTATGASSPTTP